jgi:hypothetical protein
MLQRHGYGKLANTLAVAILEEGGRGWGARVLFNYVNWQRNIFFSKLIILSYYKLIGPAALRHMDRQTVSSIYYYCYVRTYVVRIMYDT